MCTLADFPVFLFPPQSSVSFSPLLSEDIDASAVSSVVGVFIKCTSLYFCSILQDIDEMIAHARNQSYTTLLKLGSRGLSYASQVVVKTALMVSIPACILLIVQPEYTRTGPADRAARVYPHRSC